MKKGKLELTWVDKEERPRLEPRILIEDPSLSYGDPNSENILIHGDNLLALKALEQNYGGRIKCVYIDPPYNTGAAFEYYDDNLEHSEWLNMIAPRLEQLHCLLASDGFICVHIDETEGAYLKVVMDEIFGRSNYLSTMYIQVRYAQKTLKQDMLFHKQVEQVLVYRKSPSSRAVESQVDYNYGKFIWYVGEKGTPREIELGGKTVVVFSKDSYEIVKREPSPEGLKEIWASGSVLDGNSSGRFFRDFLAGREPEDGYGCLYKVFGIGEEKNPYRYFTGPKREGATRGKYYQGIPVSRQDKMDRQTKVPIPNFYDFAAFFGNCRHEGGVELKSGKKPEILLKTILQHFSEPGDWVLDSFAGSGTTGAVAHKMGRRWIMVELGDHSYSHIIPRMRGIVSGADKTGISKDVNWSGGGGFKFYRLAESLLVKDKDLSTPTKPLYVINPKYDDTMLVRAICKMENFHCLNNGHWHGASSEHHFLHVTTSLLTQKHLDGLTSDLGPDDALLIYCTRLMTGLKIPENIAVKRIPKDLLAKCTFEEERV